MTAATAPRSFEETFSRLLRMILIEIDRQT
jgi:hypothetical protein